MHRPSEDELRALRAWGERLADGPREDLRAAGRAIQLLADEVEALRVELGRGPAAAGPPDPEARSRLEGLSRNVYDALRERIGAAEPTPPRG